MIDSIRFRLAAWYALILFLILLALGGAFYLLLQRQLYEDVDMRLAQTATEIADQSQVGVDPITGQLNIVILPKDLFESPSQYIQAVETDGSVAAASQNLYGRKLPVAEIEPGSTAPIYETVELEGKRIRTLTLPFFESFSGQFLGTINVGEPLAQVDHTLTRVRNLLLIGAGIGSALAAAAGYLLASRALRPVSQITATATAIAEDTRGERLKVDRLPVADRKDELTELSATFNKMLDQIAESFQVQRRFLADASHELRTPLTALRGNIDVLSRQSNAGVLEAEELAATLEDLRRESRRMSRLVEDLLVLARTEELPATSLEPVRLDLIADDAYRSALPLATGQKLSVQSPSAVWVEGDEGRLLQLAVILLDNSLRHTPPGGKVELSVQSSNGEALMTVRDTGEGIGEEHIPHLFERFYRADSARVRQTGGTGLGLAIANAVVQLHGGSIEVASEIGKGSTFTVHLPTISEPDDAE